MPGARLQLHERITIGRGCRHGRSFRHMADWMDRSVSTISREVAHNGGRDRYSPWHAHQRAQRLAQRPKPLKLAANRRLARRVERDLARCWSPHQIAGRLRREHPDEPRWWVSHETIYRSLYLQGRGGLRRELISALRSGRTRRRPRGKNPHRHPHVPGMVMISDRPGEVDDRAVPGHWEGDLIIGTRDGSSQIGTLVERTSRFVQLVHLPNDRRAETVRDAIARKIRRLPTELVRTLTWDQGSEMAQHATFTVDTGVQIYFCDPHSPWQRGTIENTNGLLRQYFPRGADYSILSARDLDVVARELNNRPRRTLDWQTPAEVFNQLLATTP